MVLLHCVHSRNVWVCSRFARALRAKAPGAFVTESEESSMCDIVAVSQKASVRQSQRCFFEAPSSLSRAIRALMSVCD